MNNQKNNNRRDAGERKLPFVIEFIKFLVGFIALVVLGIFVLRFVSGA